MSSSWFDTKQLTSLAKNALNEAQKTLDKALDIKEGEGVVGRGQATGPPPPLLPPGAGQENEEEKDDDASSVSSSASASAAAAAAAAVTNSKLWGSFTGSFFDATQVKPSSSSPRQQQQVPGDGGQEGDLGGRGKQVQVHLAGLVLSLLLLSQNEIAGPPVVISAPPTLKSPFSSPCEQSGGSPAVAPASLASSSSAMMEEVDEGDAAEAVARQEKDEEEEGVPVSLKHRQEDQDGFSVSQVMVAEDSGDQDKEKTPVPFLTEQQQQQGGQTEELNSSMSSCHTVMDPAVSSTEQMAESSASSSSKALTAVDDQKNGLEEEEEPQPDVRNQLDEAMAEQEKRSETSSSKSYEVVNKSFPTSGATSGDELETNATSSDIEVISSPSIVSAASSAVSPVANAVRRGRNNNGNNGAQHLLQHVAVGVGGNRSGGGHARTGSEISAAGSEESCSQQEVDRLLRRITELSELLEAR